MPRNPSDNRSRDHGPTLGVDDGVAGATLGADTDPGNGQTIGSGLDEGMTMAPGTELGEGPTMGPGTGFGDGPTMFPSTGFGDGPTMGPSAGLGDGPTMAPNTGFGEGPTIAPGTDGGRRAASAFRSAASKRPNAAPAPGVTTPAAGGADQGPLSTGEAFGARYHIIRALGVGGMGAVYQAWDAELGMAVALKVIRPETTSDAAAAREMERRFKQELVLARQVTHKNVVRIHDLGEIDGIKYITMPYLEGADLSTILKAQGKLAIPAALRIVRDVAAGLVAAHEAGIVHRDLKPANIMVLGERAVIMDFGIARSSSRGDGSKTLAAHSAMLKGVPRSAVMAASTIVGTVLGTIEYMAPEQARGGPIDQRADIYALGLMFSDMLLGKRHVPPGTATAIEQLRHRLENAPTSVRSVDPAIPEAIDRLIARCVEPNPDARFQTSADLVTELDRLDENGMLRPIKRVVGLPLVVTIGSLLLAVSGGAWWYARRAIPAAPHEPVSVLIADIENRTGDPAFNHTLEPMLKRALEGASFISAFDRNAIARTVGVRPPDQLDESTARGLAVKQGLGVVLSGSLESQGGGFGITVKAAETVSGKVIAAASGKASGKDQVLGAATKLIAKIRAALGDEASESAQMFAMSSLSVTSLDVVRHYAAAMEASSNSKFEEARQSFLKALELDPKFGIGYNGLAAASRNLGMLQDAEKYINKALLHVDSMTEREKYSTRGLFYRVTGDYQQCVKEYSDLIARYAADVIGHNQLAVCYTQLRNLRRAQQEDQRAHEILPKRALFRANLALDNDFLGEFPAAEREAQQVQEPDVLSTLALAFAKLGQGQLPAATDTYRKLESVNAQGASLASSGLADIALFEGRFSDAVRTLEQGVAADLADKSGDRAAAKLTTIAYVQLLRHQNRAAITAIDEALDNSQATKIRFLAARIRVDTGDLARAGKLAAELARGIQAEQRAYAKIIEGQIALKKNDAAGAIKLLGEANDLLDTWIGRFELGRAYLQAGQPIRAEGEFDRCVNKRRGEALSLFLDGEPTYGYLPPAYYYLGHAREAMKTEGFAESYRSYLDIRGKSSEDLLLPEVRKHAAAK